MPSKVTFVLHFNKLTLDINLTIAFGVILLLLISLNMCNNQV